jgi:hypothetical protein
MKDFIAIVYVCEKLEKLAERSITEQIRASVRGSTLQQVAYDFVALDPLLFSRRSPLLGSFGIESGKTCSELIQDSSPRPMLHLRGRAGDSLLHCGHDFPGSSPS